MSLRERPQIATVVPVVKVPVHTQPSGSGNHTGGCEPQHRSALTSMEHDLGEVGAAAQVSEVARLRLDDPADQIPGLGGGDGSEAERVRCRLARLAARVGEPSGWRQEGGLATR